MLYNTIDAEKGVISIFSASSRPLWVIYATNRASYHGLSRIVKLTHLTSILSITSRTDATIPFN